MIGRGPAMQDVFGLIRRLAPHARTALVTGETGTGKELVARALHQLGPRGAQALRHRELLGGRRDALRERALRPRARRVHRARPSTRPGCSRRADGGTLFLDEVGRAAAERAGQAAARARGRRGAARRIGRVAQGRRAADRRDQPRPARRGGRRTVPQRPVLPAEHRRDLAAAAARPARGHPVSDGGVRPRASRSASTSRWSA